jgi:hypothetical protein
MAVVVVVVEAGVFINGQGLRVTFSTMCHFEIFMEEINIFWGDQREMHLQGWILAAWMELLFPDLMRFILPCGFLLIFGALTSCHTPDQAPAQPPGSTKYYVSEDQGPARTAMPRNLPIVSRHDCITTAVRYLEHQWTPTAANIMHGEDGKGIRVDTPDVEFHPPGTFAGWWVPGLVNRGLPYQWGGFSTPEQFDAGIAAGKAAGDIYTAEKRAKLDDAVSAQAVGIDCSGFVSRCWNLPRSFSTRELPLLCDPLPDYSDLQPGDILNTHNAHVVLFDAWLDDSRTYFICYEIGSPPTWKVMRHGLRTTQMKELGYQPLRYRNIR